MVARELGEQRTEALDYAARSTRTHAGYAPGYMTPARAGT